MPLLSDPPKQEIVTPGRLDLIHQAVGVGQHRLGIPGTGFGIHGTYADTEGQFAGLGGKWLSVYRQKQPGGQGLGLGFCHAQLQNTKLLTAYAAKYASLRQDGHYHLRQLANDLITHMRP